MIAQLKELTQSELAFVLTRGIELMNCHDKPPVDHNDNDEDATDNESADDASEDKAVPVVEDDWDWADANHVADLFDALNMDVPRYRSQVMVRNGQAHAVGFWISPTSMNLMLETCGICPSLLQVIALNAEANTGAKIVQCKVLDYIVLAK